MNWSILCVLLSTEEEKTHTHTNKAQMEYSDSRISRVSQWAAPFPGECVD